MFIAYLLLIVGLVVLTVGAEVMVNGASRLALSLRISPLVVGLTVVAFGTSAPELVVSTRAAFGGQCDIAVGNVLGSNIFNILVILGLTAAVTPLVVNPQLIRIDLPLMIAVSVGTVVLAADGAFTRLDGIVLVGVLACYLTFLIRHSRRMNISLTDDLPDDHPKGWQATLWQVVLMALGLAMLVGGSHLFVDNASAIARAWGVSELVIGLTLVSTGTSLPEVATSLVAALRGQRDIAVGNAVGSNLFNMMAVLGVTSVVAPEGIPVPADAMTADFPMMLGVAIVCFPLFYTRYAIRRGEGILLFVAYLIYLTGILLSERNDPRLGSLVHISLYYLLPAFSLYLLVSAFRAWRSGNPPLIGPVPADDD